MFVCLSVTPGGVQGFTPGSGLQITPGRLGEPTLVPGIQVDYLTGNAFTPVLSLWSPKVILDPFFLAIWE